MPAAISVHDIYKAYGSTVAVDGISFEIAKGEIFGIIGPNGAGKTTTVESMTGLRTPDRGEIRVLGLDPRREGSELRQRVGIQLQQAALPDRMKVREALDLYASFYRNPADWGRLLADWGLSGKENTGFGDLSGGQKQRLFIALALVNQPEVVVLDEITTGLDPQARRSTWNLVRSIRDQGVTVVLVTHFMDEVRNLCDRVAVINQGRLAALDTPDGLIASLQLGHRIRFRQPPGFDARFLTTLPGVHRVSEPDGDVLVEGEGPLMARVATALAERGIIPPDLRTESGSLDDVYLALTSGTPPSTLAEAA